MKATEKGAGHGWKLLWDGNPETVEHHPLWRDQGFFPPKDTDATVPPPGGGTLATSDDFTDFELHVDFKMQVPGANSGVYLRASKKDLNPSFSGCEIQILDDDNWEKI